MAANFTGGIRWFPAIPTPCMQPGSRFRAASRQMRMRCRRRNSLIMSWLARGGGQRGRSRRCGLRAGNSERAGHGKKNLTRGNFFRNALGAVALGVQGGDPRAPRPRRRPDFSPGQTFLPKSGRGGFFSAPHRRAPNLRNHVCSRRVVRATAEPNRRGHMPRQASADWNAADRAPEYPPGAGEKVSTGNYAATETRTEARQGVTGHNARYVLLFGTGGVIVAVALIYACCCA